MCGPAINELTLHIHARVYVRLSPVPISVIYLERIRFLFYEVIKVLVKFLLQVFVVSESCRLGCLSKSFGALWGLFSHVFMGL